MADLGEFGAELAAVDAAAGPAEPDTFTFHGHVFELPEKVSSLPALRFAHHAQQVTAAEARANAAMQRARTEAAKDAAARQMAEVELMANAGLYAYLRDMLPGQGQWERFEQVAAEYGADDTELLAVAQKIMQAVAGRPTRRSSGSPAGPSPTGRTSTGGSDSAPAPWSPPSPGVRPEDLVPSSWREPVAEPVATVTTLTPLQAARVEILEASPVVADLVRSGT